MRALPLLLALALVLPAAATSAEPEPTPGARVSEALRALSGLAGVPAREAEAAPCPALPQAVAQLAAALAVPAPALPALAPAESDAIARLVCALRDANALRDAAFADIDAQALADEIGRETGEPRVALSAEHVAANAAGARLVAEAVDHALATLRPRAPPSSLAPSSLSPPQYSFPPLLALDLVGLDTYYGDDVALVVDVGGNDLYDNNAGGSLIAFGDGGFIPIHGDPSSFGPSQCVTFSCARVVIGGDFEDAELLFSASLVLDLAGDDTYGVRRAPYHDLECTTEPVVRKVVIQGTGAGGPGLLFDLAGDNTFRAKTIAQGAGHVGGVGVLYLGPGNDRLEAVRFAQGSGLFFGLALLLDEGGDDVYATQVPSGGVLNTDGGFCDAQPRYLHGSGFARVTGGASGVAGALLDLGGNDVYVGDTKGLGFAEVASVGLFYDRSGDDTYYAVARSLGYASGNTATSGGGLALFHDGSGDDRYVLTTDQGLGASPARIADASEVPFPYSPYTFWIDEVVTTFVNPVLVAGAAVFYDGGGNDVYDSPAARANGEARATTIGGFFIDR